MLNKQFNKSLLDFENYLLTLGYSPKTAKASFLHVKEVLIFMSDSSISIISSISKKDVSYFFEQLKNRENKRRSGQISTTHYNGYVFGLRKYSKYLRHASNISIPVSHISLLKINRLEKEHLTQLEIKKLYSVTHPTSRHGIRDRAILAVYYGCGLRRDEGVSLKISDVCFKSNLLFVRNGKGNKQRYVPLSEKTAEHLYHYINYGRPLFIKNKKIRGTLFINDIGKETQSQSLYKRVKKLIEKTNINKQVGLHTLRHSIATHLLENKMNIEDISRFLGHSSLESTQIYTHVNKERIIQQLSKEE